jgi:hypothetical protein
MPLYLQKVTMFLARPAVTASSFSIALMRLQTPTAVPVVPVVAVIDRPKYRNRLGPVLQNGDEVFGKLSIKTTYCAAVRARNKITYELD